MMTTSRFAIPSGGHLPDYLAPEPDLVFVGSSPGRRSAETGHHYAGKGNHFWPLLYESGLVPEPLNYEDDWRAPEFGSGLTNLVGMASPTNGRRPRAERGRGGGGGARGQSLLPAGRGVGCLTGGLLCGLAAGRRCQLGPQP